MAYDIFLAERITLLLKHNKVNFYKKAMFGGLCYMVEDKMMCGIMFNKTHNLDLLMLRIGQDAYLEALTKPFTKPMDFTGRAMKGYIFVTPEGFDTDTDLEYWIQLALDFNPFAKASKKKSKL